MDFPGQILQYQNILTSIILTFYFLKIGSLIRPDSFDLRILSLGMLSLFQVYYRTFSFVRGEPMLAMFYLFVTFHLLYMIRNDIRQPKWHYTLQLSVGIACAILSRQWSAFMIPAIIVWGIVILIREGKLALPVFRATTIAFIMAFFMSAWFFFALLYNEGSMIAFSREPTENQNLFANHTPDFYFGLGLPDIFERPYRPDPDTGHDGFPNQFIPMMYSDTWGDYWGYFTLRGPYPGGVMVLSLFPTMILFAGLAIGYGYLIRFLMVWKKDIDKRAIMFAFIQLILFWTMVGYGWFVIQYIDPGKGGPVKGSYMLHVYPYLALLGGEALYHLKQRSRIAYPATIGLLMIVYVYSIPMYFTQRIRFF